MSSLALRTAAPTPATPLPTRTIIYLGMDVHKDSITIAVLPADAKVPTRLEKLPNDLAKLQKWIARVARDGEIRACDEASGAGYVLHRALRAWGCACEVIAPSLSPKRPGCRMVGRITSVPRVRDTERRECAITPSSAALDHRPSGEHH